MSGYYGLPHTIRERAQAVKASVIYLCRYTYCSGTTVRLLVRNLKFDKISLFRTGVRVAHCSATVEVLVALGGFRTWIRVPLRYVLHNTDYNLHV